LAITAAGPALKHVARKVADFSGNIMHKNKYLERYGDSI
jgi:hypothetical protein